MFRVIALMATVAAAGTLAGTASAHPPDLYDSTRYSTGSYGTTYTQPYYGGSTSYSTPSYVAPTYSAPTYSGSTYSAPAYSGTTYSAPSYSGTTYGASSYVAPSYSGTSSYGATYLPSFDATPSFNATTPSYTAPLARSNGYSSPGFGYRQRYSRAYGSYNGYNRQTYVPTRNAYDYRPLPRDRHRSFGPISSVPSTEGLNVGYAGGPTYGTDSNPVINGVSLNGPPN